MGCVMQAGEQSNNVARNAIMASKLPESVPGTSVDRQCGSSQQALHFAAQAVMSGTMDIVIAAGVESMTRVPMARRACWPPRPPWQLQEPGIEKHYPNIVFSEFSSRGRNFPHHFRAGELAEHDVRIMLLDARAPVVAKAGLGGQHARRAHRHPRHRLDAGGDHDIHWCRTSPLARRNAAPAATSRTGGRRVPGTLSAAFDAMMALRATLLDCSPACMTQPMMTSSIWSGAAPERSPANPAR